METLLHSTLNI